jgi:tetratricopeptide (TPR) repeat protein
VLLGRGDPGPAVERMGQSLAMFREIGNRSGEACALNSLGEAYHATGRLEEARAQHAKALAIAVDIGERYEQARAEAGLARTHHAAGDHTYAKYHGQRALVRYAELGSPEAEDIRVILTG